MDLTSSRALRSLGIALVALFAVALAARTSSAVIQLTSETKTSLTSSGVFDVFVLLSDPEFSAPPSLTSYNVTVDPVVNTTGTITPADVTLSFNAAASGNPVSKTDIFPIFDVTDTTSGTFPSVSGASASSPAVPLFDQAGLMSVAFSVTPGKVGSFTLEFDSNLTKLFDDVFSAMGNIELDGGNITIVPEPSTLGTGLLGLLALWGLRRRIS